MAGFSLNSLSRSSHKKSQSTHSNASSNPPRHFSDIKQYPAIPFIPRSDELPPLPSKHTDSPRVDDLTPNGKRRQDPFARFPEGAISHGLFNGSDSTLALAAALDTPRAKHLSVAGAPPIPSRISSLDDLSNPPSPPPRAPSVLSAYSDTTSAAHHAARASNMKPRASPLNPSTPDDGGYDTSSSIGTQKVYPRRRPAKPTRTHDILEETPEAGEEHDTLHDLRGTQTPGVLAAFAMGMTSRNFSTTSIGSKAKADKVLGLDPNAKLTSFYLVSGVPKDFEEWSFADADATRGVAQMEDSLGFFWRPDVLGAAYSGQKTEEWLKYISSRNRKGKSSGISTFTSPMSKSLKGVHVPDAGPDGPIKLINKSMKLAHPRDVEVINSTLAPPTTCHSFTFTIPKHDTLAAIARTRLDSSITNHHHHPEDESMLETVSTQARNMSAATELTFYGVTLTIWTHADPEKVAVLRKIKENKEKIKASGLDSIRTQIMPRKPLLSGRWRSSLPWGLSKQPSDADFTGSETETGLSDTDLQGPAKRHRKKQSMKSIMDDWPDETAPLYENGGDNFWTPYAITLVSRHPIYDVMQDFLRLSWSMYAKNAKYHMTQICRILNHETPRPGETFYLHVGNTSETAVTIEAVMPGALDFERGIVKVDFQLWPFFQALDIDHILTCTEVALSNSGRVMFFSKHPSMLNIAVSSLKYIAELRGWDGIAMPMLHCRDITFIIEDPGPYIIGMPSECRYMVSIPSEVIVVDLDTNSLSCKSPPAHVISSQPKRLKAKHKILASFGPGFPIERGVPVEFKISYPRGAFRNSNKFTYGHQRPSYLGERLRPPSWWKHAEIIGAFDKVLRDKHKKPSLIQRLTKSGMGRQEAQLTVGEQLAKTMMRKRALHYVETRDDLENKVGRISKRLQKLQLEGDQWKAQFETFEKYAERLAVEAAELKAKIEREQREAKRLSTIAHEQTKVNVDLEEKLKQTEGARAEAMRQLSDMHQSIQELEKEREEIMNVFEAQINSALSRGFPMDDSSRPSTPSGSILSSPKSHFTGRPGTRDSANSGLSRFTTDTQPISVLGAVRGMSTRRKRGDKISIMDVEQERMIVEKTDGIAARIANIQQKLEMALSSVTNSEVDVASQADEDEPSNSLGLTVDVDPAQVSHKTSRDTMRSPDATSKPTLDVEVSPEHQPTSQKSSDDEALIGPKSAAELGLLPRGKSLRIKRRSVSPESESADSSAGDTTTTTINPKKTGQKRLVRRDKLSTGPAAIKRQGTASSEEFSEAQGGANDADMTFGEEAIITPSTSEQNVGVVPRMGDKRKSVGEESEIRAESRLSVISNSTATFGHAL